MKSKLQNQLKKMPIHFWVMLTGWLSRLIFGPVQLLAIPVFYQRLGLEDFAIFTIITGLTAWYALMDFGIGTALQNYISESRAQNVDPAALLTKVFPLILGLLLFLAILIMGFGKFLESWLFSHYQNPLSPLSFKINLILYCWYFVLLISTKIFFAYQKGFWGYFYQSAAYLILLLLIGFIHFFDIHLSLSSALYIWVLPLFFSAVISFIHVFYTAKAKITLGWDGPFLRQLKSRALKFWFVGLSANGVLAIDYLIIVKLLSAKDIVTYNIMSKIFFMMIFAYSALLSALWPTLAEHYAKKTQLDYQLAEREIRRAITGGLLYMCFITGVVILCRNLILSFFQVNQAIEMPITLILLFGLYGCTRIWVDTYCIAVQARSLMRIFILLTPVQAIIAIPSMLLLAKYHLIGVMLALIFSFFAIPVWVLPWYHYKQSKLPL